jgi:asparagine synthase (glutamine-hydrolysing)
MFSYTRCEELRSRLTQAADDQRQESILLSGGLDSSILASIIKPLNAITVGLGPEAEDLSFAAGVAKMFCSRHIRVVINEQTLLAIMNKLVSLMRTFDPIEIRNSAVLYAGIEESVRRGYKSVITGDGCDELFAGYDYMRRFDGRLHELENELHRIWKIMHFSSQTIGRELGVDVSSPFLDNMFLEYAKVMKTSEKIGFYDGKRWGKFILRKCFEKDIGKGVAWREKKAQETGANITMISSIINEACSDKLYRIEKNNAMQEGVTIRDKEHLYYYLLFRRTFSPPMLLDKSFIRRCPKCLGPFFWKGSYCRTCGSYGIEAVSR